MRDMDLCFERLLEAIEQAGEAANDADRATAQSAFAANQALADRLWQGWMERFEAGV
jgi:hypothetical protein